MLSAVIADDSGVMRQILGEILESGNVEVVARAVNGYEAVEAIETHEPDVATVDIEMPGMDGLEVIDRVMATTPTPILVISAHTDRAADATFEALELGAVDFIAKPSGELSVDIWSQRDEILADVEAVARVDATRVADGISEPESTPTIAATDDVPDHPTLVIGSSTGGPKVVERVLAELPRSIGLRILVVQHMADHYTGRFAARLNERTAYEVREAADGETVEAGEVVVARGGYHLDVVDVDDGRVRIELEDGPQRHNVKPAIDPTMESAAKTVPDALVGAVLTGMGADGADGISAVKAAGGKTIAQDEATSRVFGMPRQAIETGDVDMVLPEGRIAEGIVNAFRGWSS